MSFWNLFSVKQNSVEAVIDIGSAQVSGALISVSTNNQGRKQNRLIFNTKAETGIDGELDFERFDWEIIKAIKKVTHDLVKSGFHQPTKFSCFLSSPFLVSQTKVINYSQADQFVFTPKILDSISRREAEDFRLRNEGEKQFNLIENKIMQIKLNGYELAQPFGHKVNQLTLAQFLSGSPASQLAKIRQAISSQSHNNKVEFHSYTFSAFSALRDGLGGQKNFLAVDVGGELTDVFVAMDGVLLENISFPYGLNSIIRSIARAQGTFQNEAKSQLALYAEGRLQARAKDIFERSLESARQKWTAGLAEALMLILANSVLPEQIILTGDTGANKIFVSWLKAGAFKKYLLSNNYLRQ